MGKRICVIDRLGIPQDLRDPADGGAVNATAVVRACAEAGHSVDVFTTRIAPSSDQHLPARVRVFRMPESTSTERDSFDRYMVDAKAFATTLCHSPLFAADYDAIHVNHWSSAVAPLTEALRDRGRKLVFTPHLLAAEKAEALRVPLPPTVEFEERAILHCSDAVIALSATQARYVSRRYSIHPGRVRVIPNGIDDIFHPPALPMAKNWRDGERLVISVGRLARQKDHETLVRAVHRLLEDRPRLRVHVAIVGGTWGENDHERELDELISRLGLRNHVSLCGTKTRLELADMLRTASIYVQSSRCETQGIAILEAMATGLPLVVTALPAVKEYVRHGHNGFLFRVSDFNALANHLSVLLDSPSLCSEISRRNISSSKQFSRIKSVSATLECFDP